MSWDSKKTVNKVILIGCIGQDVELKKTPSGASVVNFSIATTTSYKDQSGQYQDVTEWSKIVAWQKTADYIAQNAKKGTRVYVEGKLQTRSWEKDGQKHYSTEIVADQVQILDGGQKSEPQTEQAPPEPEWTEEQSGARSRTTPITTRQ